jgi:RNA polymerase sigma-70 factor, ECF subfamily
LARVGIPASVAAVSQGKLAGALFEEFQPRLYRFCLSRLRSREDAEDAVQATFVRAVGALERGVRPEIPSAWLFTIARNVCLSRRLAGLRRRRVETPRDLDTLPADALACRAERPEELLRLNDALAEMPPELQRVVLLREWQGLSYREIAADLGVSTAAVETLIFRGRRDLARRLRRLLDFGPLLGLKALFGGATAAAVVVSSTALQPRPVPHRPAPARVPTGVAVVPHPVRLEVAHIASAPHRRGAHQHVRPAVTFVEPPAAAARAPRRQEVQRVAVVHRPEPPLVGVRPPEPTSPQPTEPAPAPAAPAPAQAPERLAAPVAAPVAATVAAATAAVPDLPVPAPAAQAVDTVEQTATTAVGTVASSLPPTPPLPTPAVGSVLP